MSTCLGLGGLPHWRPAPPTAPAPPVPDREHSLSAACSACAAWVVKSVFQRQSRKDKRARTGRCLHWPEAYCIARMGVVLCVCVCVCGGGGGGETQKYAIGEAQTRRGWRGAKHTQKWVEKRYHTYWRVRGETTHVVVGRDEAELEEPVGHCLELPQGNAAAAKHLLQAQFRSWRQLTNGTRLAMDTTREHRRRHTSTMS